MTDEHPIDRIIRHSNERVTVVPGYQPRHRRRDFITLGRFTITLRSPSPIVRRPIRIGATRLYCVGPFAIFRTPNTR